MTHIAKPEISRYPDLFFKISPKSSTLNKRNRPLCPSVKFKNNGPNVSVMGKVSAAIFQWVYPAIRISSPWQPTTRISRTHNQRVAAAGNGKRVIGCSSHDQSGELLW